MERHKDIKEKSGKLRLGDKHEIKRLCSLQCAIAQLPDIPTCKCYDVIFVSILLFILDILFFSHFRSSLTKKDETLNYLLVFILKDFLKLKTGSWELSKL